jgi:hypothetical protein
MSIDLAASGWSGPSAVLRIAGTRCAGGMAAENVPTRYNLPRLLTGAAASSAVRSRARRRRNSSWTASGMKPRRQDSSMASGRRVTTHLNQYHCFSSIAPCTEVADRTPTRGRPPIDLEVTATRHLDFEKRRHASRLVGRRGDQNLRLVSENHGIRPRLRRYRMASPKVFDCRNDARRLALGRPARLARLSPHPKHRASQLVALRDCLASFLEPTRPVLSGRARPA